MKTHFSTLTFLLSFFGLLRNIIKNRYPIFFGFIKVILFSLDVLDVILILFLLFIIDIDIEF